MKFLALALLLSVFTTQAQEKKEEAKKDASKKEMSGDKMKNSVSIYAGYPGVGFGYAREINDKFSIRFVQTYFSYKFDINDASFASRKGNVKGNFRFNSIDVLADYHLPFANNMFKVVGGISYLTTSNLTATVKPASDATYGMLTISKDMLGDVQANVDWSGFAPYLGVGYGKAVPKGKWGWGVDLGTHFLVSKAKVDFVGTGSLAPTAAYQQDEFKAWVDKFKIVPTLMVNVNYKF